MILSWHQLFHLLIDMIPPLESWIIPFSHLHKSIIFFQVKPEKFETSQFNLLNPLASLASFPISLNLSMNPWLRWGVEMLFFGTLGFLGAVWLSTRRQHNPKNQFPKKEQESTDQIQQLTQQVEKQRSIIETFNQVQQITQIGYWESNIQNGKLTWSEPIESIFGFLPGTFPGTREAFYDTVHPEDRIQVQEAVKHCIQTGEPYSVKHRILHKNGTIRWILEQGGISIDADGQPSHLYGIVKDITQQELAEEEVWLFKTISDQANYGTMILDLDGNILYANRAFAHLLNVPIEKLQGLPIFDLDESERDEESPSLFEYLQEKGELQSEEILLKRNDGFIFPVLINATAIYNDKGTRIYYSATAIDITDYKQAEEGLRSSEEFLQSILDALYSNIAVLDQNGTIITVNQAWKRFADENGNRDPYYGIGQNYLKICNQSIASNSKESPKVAEGIKKVMQGELEQFTLEYPCHSQFEKRWFMMSVTLGNQDPLRVVISHRNVTQLKLAEEALVHARDEAESANRAKSYFLANMSHEIRTPLNAILGFCQILQRDSDFTAKQRNYVETIIRSGEHLLALINNILEMSKIEAGKSLSDLHPFDLYNLIHDLEIMFITRAVAKGIKIDTDIASNVPQCIIADENKLRQILINLIGNALKFTEEGGIALRIEAKLKPINEVTLSFEVTDTGLGIGEDEIKNLFTPFHQTLSGLRIQGGTGLGLAISNEFIRQMGGEISVTSELGKGSSFNFNIPVKEADFNILLQKRKKQTVASLAPDQKHYRILVVDDIETNRNLLTLLLGELGFEVSVAENGVVAVDLFKEWNPDLILMDMKMPIMDGYEATEIIKSLPGGDNTKIIALTASAFEENKQAILSKGADGYICKPYKEEELFKKIGDLIGAKYIYSEEEYDEEENHTLEQTHKSDLIKQFQTLPSEILRQMNTFALNAEKDPLLELIQRINIVDADLASFLKNLIEKYEYETLTQLIQESIDLK